jgi:hypothetical protein
VLDATTTGAGTFGTITAANAADILYFDIFDGTTSVFTVEQLAELLPTQQLQLMRSLWLVFCKIQLWLA